MKKQMTYDSAYAELNRILQQLQNDESGLDELSTQLTRAGELVKFCREKLRSIEEDLDKLNQNELNEQL